MKEIFMSWKTFIAPLLGLMLLSWGGQSAAQDIIVYPPQVPAVPVPKIKGISPEMQRQLEWVFQQDALQPRFILPSDGSFSWGGARLIKADLVLRQQLGLDAKEGLLV